MSRRCTSGLEPPKGGRIPLNVMGAPAAASPAVACRTVDTNAAWLPKGSALQIRSSSVQPSGRSGLRTPESIPPGRPGRKGGANVTFCSGDQPYGQASLAAMVSVAEPARAPASRPNATDAVLVISAGTSPDTSTTILIGG